MAKRRGCWSGLLYCLLYGKDRKLERERERERERDLSPPAFKLTARLEWVEKGAEGRETCNNFISVRQVTALSVLAGR